MKDLVKSAWRKRKPAQMSLYPSSSSAVCAACLPLMALQSARTHQEVFKWQKRYLLAAEEIKRLQALLDKQSKPYQLPDLNEPLPSFIANIKQLG
jgi:hypothetical protein